MNTLHSESLELEYDEVATLQRLALEGAMDEPITLSTRSLGEILNVSTQTISRRLRRRSGTGWRSARTSVAVTAVRQVGTASVRHGPLVRAVADGRAVVSGVTGRGSIARVVGVGAVAVGVLVDELL
jgi:hypothetical protein